MHTLTDRYTCGEFMTDSLVLGCKRDAYTHADLSCVCVCVCVYVCMTNSLVLSSKGRRLLRPRRRLHLLQARLRSTPACLASVYAK